MRDRARRHPRRVQVRFWPEGDPSSSYAGYSRNISATGMFIATVHPSKPGHVLEIEFRGEGYEFKVRGQVVHSAKVSPLLQSVRPSGMGIKFLDRSLQLERLLPAESARTEGDGKSAVFPMYFPTGSELVAIYDRDIKNGGLFVPTTRPAAMEERVTIELHLPRPRDPVLSFEARVVHRVPEGDGSGMGISFLDQEDVVGRLASLVESFR